MEKVNKFQIFAIIIICTFLFVIAAIYTNTKDVVSDKAPTPKTEKTSEKIVSHETERSMINVAEEFESLNERINNIDKKLDNTINSYGKAGNLKCRIAGSLNAQGMEEMSPLDAINSAKNNNTEMVVLCSF